MRQLFSYGGHDLTPHITVTGVTRSIAPTRKIERTEIPGMAGELARPSGFEATEITVTGHLTSQSIDGTSDLRRILAQMLVSDGQQKLILPDEPTKYMMALYKGGAELSRGSKRPKVGLSFLCPDPVAYGEHRTQQVSGTQYVDAGGTYPASPVITVKPPSGSYWQVTNVATGEYVRVDASFNGSQTVVLDFALGRCAINGSDARVNIASDFFKLSGVQQVKVSSGTATIEWDERWL